MVCVADTAPAKAGKRHGADASDLLHRLTDRALLAKAWSEELCWQVYRMVSYCCLTYLGKALDYSHVDSALCYPK
jgi:hypothetical protein